MLTIRFSRVGRKNRAQFRVVVQEHTKTPTGRHVEIVGSYDPKLKIAALKQDRIKYWMDEGAQISDSAYNLFVKEGVIEGSKRLVKIPKKAIEEAEAKAKEAEGEKAEVEEKTEAKEEKPEEAAK